MNILSNPDVLLHLAWRDSFVHTSPFHIQDLPSHYAFLKKMVDEGIDRVCVMGSMHEIGFFEGSIHEDTPCHPMNLYGISKNALRNCVELMTANTKTKWQWLRGYYIVGNSEFGDSIFSKITKAEHEGKKNSHLLWVKINMILLIIKISVCKWLLWLVKMKSTELSI